MVVVPVVVVVVRCERNRAPRDVRPDVNQSCRIARLSVRRTVSIVAARAASDECQRSTSIARQGDVRETYTRYGSICRILNVRMDGEGRREREKIGASSHMCACVASGCMRVRKGDRDRRARSSKTAYRSVCVRLQERKRKKVYTNVCVCVWCVCTYIYKFVACARAHPETGERKSAR